MKTIKILEKCMKTELKMYEDKIKIYEKCMKTQ